MDLSAKRIRERQEDEANLFAMCLLMPEVLVRKEVESIGGIDLNNDKKVLFLALKFGVPQTLMAIRIGQLFNKLKKPKGR